ncbi:MAG TPA: hypothetical protein VKV29_09560 [Chthonomonas sp.]|jgi:hypothetical protein|uniref:hypothetical protein n=1 Tax=Chthonomonas sp. TaxID=2282153 RepID=UPI002B4B38A1|nr:hypothetical protein [Chthonomonas sp.]HLH80513.1 hypothetical protein [Chthonomonas sp.]
MAAARWEIDLEEPWWLTAAKDWGARVKAVMEGQGPAAAAWRALLLRRLEQEPPHFVYRFYEEWRHAMETTYRGRN